MEKEQQQEGTIVPKKQRKQNLNKEWKRVFEVGKSFSVVSEIKKNQKLFNQVSTSGENVHSVV